MGMGESGTPYKTWNGKNGKHERRSLSVDVDIDAEGWVNGVRYRIEEPAQQSQDQHQEASAETEVNTVAVEGYDAHVAAPQEVYGGEWSAGPGLEVDDSGAGYAYTYADAADSNVATGAPLSLVHPHAYGQRQCYYCPSHTPGPSSGTCGDAEPMLGVGVVGLPAVVPSGYYAPVGGTPPPPPPGLATYYVPGGAVNAGYGVGIGHGVGWEYEYDVRVQGMGAGYEHGMVVPGGNGAAMSADGSGGAAVAGGVQQEYWMQGPAAQGMGMGMGMGMNMNMNMNLGMNAGVGMGMGMSGVYYPPYPPQAPAHARYYHPTKSPVGAGHQQNQNQQHHRYQNTNQHHHQHQQTDPYFQGDPASMYFPHVVASPCLSAVPVPTGVGVVTMGMPMAVGPPPCVRERHTERERFCDRDRERDAAPERNQLNLLRIEDGQDTRTTVMIKNIPNKMSDRDLVAFIGSVCERRVDFLYLRMDFQNGGYEFFRVVP
jgi:hypothetical protein